MLQQGKANKCGFDTKDAYNPKNSYAPHHLCKSVAQLAKSNKVIFNMLGPGQGQGNAGNDGKPTVWTCLQCSTTHNSENVRQCHKCRRPREPFVTPFPATPPRKYVGGQHAGVSWPQQQFSLQLEFNAAPTTEDATPNTTATGIKISHPQIDVIPLADNKYLTNPCRNIGLGAKESMNVDSQDPIPVATKAAQEAQYIHNMHDQIARDFGKGIQHGEEPVEGAGHDLLETCQSYHPFSQRETGLGRHCAVCSAFGAHRARPEHSERPRAIQSPKPS